MMETKLIVGNVVLMKSMIKLNRNVYVSKAIINWVRAAKKSMITVESY